MNHFTRLMVVDTTSREGIIWGP